MFDLKDKEILIAGYGKTGAAVAKVAQEMGADISIYDQKSQADAADPRWQVYVGGTVPPVKKWDLLVISPGISPEADFIQKAVAEGTEMIGELEFAYRISQGEFIAITGTNGKTTTTTLVGEIYKAADHDTRVVGNIGEPAVLSAYASNIDTAMITEVSSFQLETIKEFKPRIAAVLNITPDHMDRHKNMENYSRIKARIFENQDENDYLILNYDDERTRSLAGKARSKTIFFSKRKELNAGAFVKDGMIVMLDKEKSDTAIEICAIEELLIPGEHNLENALAAVAVSYYGGISPEVISDTLKKFKGVPHRLELAGVAEGVRFVNDSKGTNPDASIRAIQATEPRIFLIAGGYEKDADFTGLINSFDGKVAYLLLLGQTAKRIEKKAHELGFDETYICKDMNDCVNKGFELAWPGDTVLLSPASASWDMYPNYEKRGDDFKDSVARLKRGVRDA